jgi:hypothetical protein
MILVEIFERGWSPRYPLTVPNRVRQLMIAIARSGTSNGDHSYYPSSVGGEPRPMTTVVRQLTVAAIATVTRSPCRHTPLPLFPVSTPSGRLDPDVAADCTAALKSP